jgi:hypothetical protein
MRTKVLREAILPNLVTKTMLVAPPWKDGDLDNSCAFVRSTANVTRMHFFPAFDIYSELYDLHSDIIEYVVCMVDG